MTTDYQDHRRQISRDTTTSNTNTYLRPRDASHSASNSVREAYRRSLTRGSYYSHGDVSASTRSWVNSTQQNPPPPPPPAEPIPLPTPVYGSRPLPLPGVQAPMQQQHYNAHVLRAINADPPDDDEEEYMSIERDDPALNGAYLTETMGRGRRTPKKKFVGGFMKGLKRLPKAVFRYGGGSSSKKGEFIEGTVTSGEMATLPKYMSNPPTPVADPLAGGNSQYHNTMPGGLGQDIFTPPQIPQLTLSPDATYPTRRSQIRRVTPPSDFNEQGNDGGSQQLYRGTSYSQHTSNTSPPPQNSIVGLEDRTTMMVYQEEQEMPPQTPPLTINRRISYASQTPMQNRRISYISQGARGESVAHTPASTNLNIEPVTMPTPITTSAPMPDTPAPAPAPEIPEQAQSPVSAHPLPAMDYLKMTGTMSPSPTSRNTMATSFSHSPSSMAIEVTSPVFRFFHTLYHMPWISHKRVTVDYRPGNGPGGQSGGRGIVKRPMSSWYKRIGQVRRDVVSVVGDVDLLSTGTGSRRTSAGTNRTPVVSPTTRRPRRATTEGRRRTTRHHSHGHGHRHDSDSHHRRHRHTRRDTNSTAASREAHKQRSMSPLIPPIYPYQYPAYPFPYPMYSPPQVPSSASPQANESRAKARESTSTAATTPTATPPRGLRSSKSRTFPHGYASPAAMAAYGHYGTPYQHIPPVPPLPMTTPVYVLQTQSSSPSLASGFTAGAGMGNTGIPGEVPLQLIPGQQPHHGMFSPMYMQIMPGGLGPTSDAPSSGGTGAAGADATKGKTKPSS